MNTRTWLLGVAILLVAVSRLIPHPWNVTPVLAIALFGGGVFRKGWQAFAVCLGALLLSDIALAARADYPWFYPDQPVTYAAFAIAVTMGMILRRRRHPAVILGVTLGASLQFFFLSNLGVWLLGGLYPRTLDGLAECFTVAIPFYRSAMVGDLVFTLALFGAYHLAERAYPSPRPRQPADTRA